MDNASAAIDDQLARFTELLSTCQSRLLASVYAIVQNMADAEDVCQRSALILWRKFSEYDEGTDFQAWAIAVCRFEALNFVRKRRGDRLYFSEEVLAALVDAQEERLKDLQATERRWSQLAKCIEQLPPNQRRLIELYYGNDSSESRSIAAVAGVVKSSEGALRTALCRVRQSLRRCIDQEASEANA